MIDWNRSHQGLMMSRDGMYEIVPHGRTRYGIQYFTLNYYFDRTYDIVGRRYDYQQDAMEAAEQHYKENHNVS